MLITSESSFHATMSWYVLNLNKLLNPQVNYSNYAAVMQSVCYEDQSELKVYYNSACISYVLSVAALPAFRIIINYFALVTEDERSNKGRSYPASCL